ncbi:hypothetical protein [Acidianus infernus]|uniref:hypothetical protein n=1 Tax=Acidianus infernus TaxID=12915 RepID=UPI003593A086
MSPLLMVIIGLAFAIIIAFFVVLIMPVEFYSQPYNKQYGNLYMLAYYRNLEINYSEAGITYYVPASLSNVTVDNFILGPPNVTLVGNIIAGPAEYSNVCFNILPRFVCTNSGNSKITFNISIHVYSNICDIHVSIPAGEGYYHICSIYENMTNNKILLSITIKLNNLQKDSLLIIPIKVNSCTQYLQIYVN